MRLPILALVAIQQEEVAITIQKGVRGLIQYLQKDLSSAIQI